MATCTIRNLTVEQARIFAEWYSGQGEQDAIVWFEEANDVETPMTERYRVLENGDTEIIIRNQDGL